MKGLGFLLSFLSVLMLITGPAPALADPVEKWVGKLDSPKASERREAAVHLGRSADARAVPPLVRLLHDPEPMVRLDVSGALIEIGKPSVSPLLAAIRTEEDAVFLWNAIRVLEELGDPRAIEPLKAIQKNHPDESIRKIAEYTLDTLIQGKRERAK